MIRFLRNEWLVFLMAVQFLTRLPVSVGDGYSKRRFATTVRHFPLVGLLIGAIAALAFHFSSLLWPQSLAVLVATAASLLLTGAFHEDGLADTFDGIGGGSSSDRALEIMKDSRIGTFGALALVVVLGSKVTALSHLSSQAVVVALMSAHCLSRLSSVTVIATSRYVRDAGTAKPVANGVSMAGLGFALSTGALCCAAIYILLSPVIMLAAMTGVVIGHFSARLVFERKIGGYTGDCLGATQQLSEVGLYLGVLACL